MVFGFKKRNDDDDEDDDDEDEEDDDDDEDEEEDEDEELIAFQGALNGRTVDMATNARLVQLALKPTRRFVSEVLDRRAEGMRLDVKGQVGQTTLVIDGVAYAGQRLPRERAVAIGQMIKVLAGFDTKLRGKVQSGGLKAEYKGFPYEILIEATPQEGGSERITLRARNLKSKLETLEDLGMPLKVKQDLREQLAHRSGVVVVCGPAGSGTSTTLYAMLRGIDMYLHAVSSLVDMGSRDVYNAPRFETMEGDSLDKTIERMRRAEMDIVFAQPLISPEVVKPIFENADRIGFLSEMPTRDVISTVYKLAEMVGDVNLVADRLKAVYSQKLLRALCPNCRQAFRPNPKLLGKVGLPPETKILYRTPQPEVDEDGDEIERDPCEKCGDIGYFGRLAMLEILVMTDPLREALKKKVPPDQFRTLARTGGMQTFQRDGIRLVVEGKTSLEELQRVFKAT